MAAAVSVAACPEALGSLGVALPPAAPPLVAVPPPPRPWAAVPLGTAEALALVLPPGRECVARAEADASELAVAVAVAAALPLAAALLKALALAALEAPALCVPASVAEAAAEALPVALSPLLREGDEEALGLPVAGREAVCAAVLAEETEGVCVLLALTLPPPSDALGLCVALAVPAATLAVAPSAWDAEAWVVAVGAGLREGPGEVDALPLGAAAEEGRGEGEAPAEAEEV